MVGTHFPEERDVVQSALQRMREAFDGLHDGQLDPDVAQTLFLSGYVELLDATSMLFLTRRYPPPAPDADHA